MSLFRRKNHQPVNPHPPKDTLVFAFTDTHGKSYYEFPEGLAMPMTRIFKIQDYMTWMSRGLTADNIRDIGDRMDILLTEGIKTGKNGVKLGVLISELRDRNERFVPLELVYNYLACYYVREDENTLIVNEQIQKEKVAEFKNAAETVGLDSFFFQLKEYKRLSASLTTLNVNWDDIVQESQLHQKKFEAMMKITEFEKS